MPTLPPDLILRPSTSDHGRSVAAKRSFSAGSVIAVFAETGPNSSPSIAIPDSTLIDHTCSHCLRVDADYARSLEYVDTIFLRPLTSVLKPPVSSGDVPAGAVVKVRECTGCRVARYCSVECQKLNWKLVHGKGECKAYKNARLQSSMFGLSQVPPTPVRTLIQVMTRPDMQKAIDEMEGHGGKKRVAPGTTPFEMSLQIRVALEWLGLGVSTKNMSWGSDITHKLQVNSFNRKDVEFGQSGIYVNAAVAMINHSCIPNAYVTFAGRNAILHAYEDIKEGDEVTISYTENDCHLSKRQHHLKTHYYFDCKCIRCKNDLDVYQVCQMFPNLELNSSDPFSLVPDIDKLRNPPVKQFLNSSEALIRNVEEIHPKCTPEMDMSDTAALFQQLRQRWKLCEQLRKAGLYAIEPFYQVLNDIYLYLARKGKFAHAFAIICFLALNVHPYVSPPPFFPTRVKCVFMIAKILALGPFPGSTKNGEKLATRISQLSSKIDQPTMCQALLVGVIHYCPTAKSDEWQLRYRAQNMLEDLKSLPGRDTENALVEAFARNPKGSEERRFFKTVVLEPIREAAGLALEIIDAQFGG